MAQKLTRDAAKTFLIQLQDEAEWWAKPLPGDGELDKKTAHVRAAIDAVIDHVRSRLEKP